MHGANWFWHLLTWHRTCIEYLTKAPLSQEQTLSRDKQKC